LLTKLIVNFNTTISNLNQNKIQINLK